MTPPNPPLDPSPPPASTLGTNQSGMRAWNERLVLTLIRRHGELAKAEIARHAGLTAQSVSVLIRALERDGLVLKGTPRRGRVGQPRIPIRLNPEGAYFLGLRIGRRSAEMVLTNFLGSVQARRGLAYRVPSYEDVLRFGRDSAAALRQSLPASARARLAGLGVAMPFRLWDWPGAEKGEATGDAAPGDEAAVLRVWRDRSIRDDLARDLGLPVTVQKDASAACGAELVFGTGEAAPNFLYFFIGHFIGGGLVLNGGLFEGATGNAGALGSLRVQDRRGRSVQLIELASLRALERALQAAGHDGAAIRGTPEGWAVPPRIVADWLEQAAFGLAQAIQATVAVTDVRAVKIDGWLPAALRAALVEQVARQLADVDFAGLEPPSVQPGTVGPDARVIGAASQPLLARFMTGFTL